MPINPARLSAEDALPEQIEDLKRQVREIKAAQLLGSDNASVQILEGSFNLGSILANQFGGAIISVTPEFGGLLLLNWTMDIRVDTDDANHQWPNGASLSAGQGNCLPSVYGAALTPYTDDNTGMRGYYISVENFDTNPHNYFLKYKFYGLVNSYA